MRCVCALAVALGAAFLAGCSSEESPNDRARDVLEENGVDPASELAYEHFLYFMDEADARAAETDLSADGYSVELEPPDADEVDWTVVARKTEALSSDELDDLVGSMEDLAAEHDGVYDGWGTPIGG